MLSGGKKYDGRAAAPILQLAADATVEAVRALHAYIESLPIDPVLDARCMLLDDNGEPLVKEPVGTRSADGKHCIVQGEKLPIGENWWRDRKKSLVCRDSKLSDSLMYRRPNNHGYHVLHRPWVGEDCVLRENVYDGPSPETAQLPRTVQLAVLGTQTPDRKGCIDPTGHVHPVGTQYYREEGHQWICAAPRIEEQRDRCFLALAELPQKMQNQVTPLGRISRALDQGMSRKAESIDKLPEQAVQTAENVAEGKITLTTIKGTLRAKAQYLAEHATLGEAQRWVREEVEEIKKWKDKSAIEQGEDVARGAGDAMIPHPATVAATVVTGGIGRGVLRAGEGLEEVAQVGKQLGAAGKQAAHAAKAAQHAEHAAAEAIKAE
ncbi:MAG TPA: hypothetical protein PKI03_34315 [Pseudomonadota bacterium]|nr:hypothetical protein [Pseudomonadota bacterium]